MYDFIYAVAPSKYLTQLNSAYNQLMRTVLGVRKAEHIKISELYSMTKFTPLANCRQASLYNFMVNVEDGHWYSMIKSNFVKATHIYSTRSSEKYVIPVCRTAKGEFRISVRGLRLLNKSSV
jgi:hypothetical protein